MVITILDEGGNLIAKHRMDDVWLASIDISQNKAWTSVDSPIDPIDPVKVKEVMDLIVIANIFARNTRTLVSSKEARLVEHNVTEYEII